MENLPASQAAFLREAAKLEIKISRAEKLSELEKTMLLAHYLNKKATRKEQRYAHP